MCQAFPGYSIFRGRCYFLVTQCGKQRTVAAWANTPTNIGRTDYLLATRVHGRIARRLILRERAAAA